MLRRRHLPMPVCPVTTIFHFINKRDVSLNNMMSQTKLYVFGAIGGLIVAGIVILVIALTSTETVVVDEAAFGSWHLVEPADGLFSAGMPAGPEEAEALVPIENSDEAILQRSYAASDENGNGYLISTFVYPAPFEEDQSRTILAGALEGMVGAVDGGTLEKSRFETHLGLPSVDFAVSVGEVNYQGKMLVKDRVLYQIMVAYDSGML